MSPILIDTNLAVLFFVGQTNRTYIKSHKRLQKYNADDFDSLSTYIAASSRWILCPHVLAETSNMIRYLDPGRASEVMQLFENLIQSAEEEYTPSAKAASHTQHTRLGLTDSVLLTMAETGAVLLTDDLDLYLAAVGAGLDAINFAHDQERRFEA